MFAPKTQIVLVWFVAAVTDLLLLITAFGISTNFSLLRFGIMTCLFALAILSFLLGYAGFGALGLALGLFFSPLRLVHLPRYIWTMMDILAFIGVGYFAYWATDPYKKGIRFEQYVSTLFPETDFAISDRTRDISKFSSRRVQSDRHPDFVFRERKTGRLFAVECKWRGQWAKGRKELGLWWDTFSGSHYLRFEKENGIPVFVVFGVGGTPERPRELYMLESTRLQRAFLPQSLIRSGNMAGQFFRFFPTQGEMVVSESGHSR